MHEFREFSYDAAFLLQRAGLDGWSSQASLVVVATHSEADSDMISGSLVGTLLQVVCRTHDIQVSHQLERSDSMLSLDTTLTRDMVCAQKPTSSIASPTSQLGRLFLKIIHSGFTAFVHRHAVRWTDNGVGGGNGLSQAGLPH